MTRMQCFALLIAFATASPIVLAGDATPSAALGPSAPKPVPAANSPQAQNAALIEKAGRHQDQVHEKNLELMERTEQGIVRQEKDIARFEKILDTWERQQAQYQKYLDSLPTSKDHK